MSTDALNANPTILNISDLPTRRRPPPSTHLQQGDGSSSGTLLNGLNSTPFGAPLDLFAESPTSSKGGESDEGVIDDDGDEDIDEQEIFDLISTISDPEHPLSLGSLAVVSLPDIHIRPPLSPHSGISTVQVLITPTITHCSLATVIGLGVRVRLEQALPPRFRVDVRIKQGTHSTAEQVTKQLNDKERVAAALENGSLMGVLDKMLETCK